DEGITTSDVQIAGRDDVGLPEEHEAVAVGVRGGLMDDVHAFAVEVELLVVTEERARWPRRGRRRELPVHTRAHALVRVEVRENLRALCRVADIASDVAAGNRRAGLAQ